MSNINDRIRIDTLLKFLEGKDISNLTIILGTCYNKILRHVLTRPIRKGD